MKVWVLLLIAIALYFTYRTREGLEGTNLIVGPGGGSGGSRVWGNPVSFGNGLPDTITTLSRIYNMTPETLRGAAILVAAGSVQSDLNALEGGNLSSDGKAQYILGSIVTGFWPKYEAATNPITEADIDAYISEQVSGLTPIDEETTPAPEKAKYNFLKSNYENGNIKALLKKYYIDQLAMSSPATAAAASGGTLTTNGTDAPGPNMTCPPGRQPYNLGGVGNDPDNWLCASSVMNNSSSYTGGTGAPPPAARQGWTSWRPTEYGGTKNFPPGIFPGGKPGPTEAEPAVIALYDQIFNAKNSAELGHALEAVNAMLVAERASMGSGGVRRRDGGSGGRSGGGSPPSESGVKVWGPDSSGMGTPIPGLLGGEGTDGTENDPAILGGVLGKFKGAEAKGTLPNSGGLGSDANSRFLPYSRTPGDMDLVPDPYRISSTFSTSSYSSKTEPAPFLADFSAFLK